MKKYISLFTLSFSLVLSGLAQDYSDYTGCVEQDSLALVAFYWATDGPNWTSNNIDNFSIDYLSDDVYTYYTTDYPNAGLNHWFDGPIKDWFGVTLAKRAVENSTDSVWRVIHLHPTLSRRSAGQNELNGYVPKEVGLLTALEWFKINGNDGLEGTEVPDELYHSSIISFDFEGVFFSGILSNALCNCTNLKYTNFRDNDFDSIPDMDFITDPWVSLWVYRNKIPWSTLENTVDYYSSKGYEFEARDQSEVGKASEIIVTSGSSVTLTCNYAGENGTCTWLKNGMNTYMTGTTYTINDISDSDTGDYTVLVENEYIRLLDENSDYGSTYTKPIHVAFTPSTPYLEKAYTSYDGNTVTLEFSKPMAVPSTSQISEFTVMQNSISVPISTIKRSGRLQNKIVLTLSNSIEYEDSVTLSYNKGTIIDTNGGEVNSFSGKSVTNYTREAINIVSATTRSDGGSIIIEFDKYVDPDTFNPSDFSIGGTTNYTVNSISIISGEIDNDITKKIALVTTSSMSLSDELKVSYTKGSLTALYGATLQSFSDFDVVNIITEQNVAFQLKLIDGTSELEEVIIKGDMKALSFALYDDGTNGDNIADDDIWTTDIKLNDGDYTWQAYSRTTEITYDTSRIENADGSITLTLIPVENYTDELLSSTLNVSVSFDNSTVDGDTIFEYRTKSLTVILNMKDYKTENSEKTIEPYLMGIDDDWTDGIKMETYGDSLNYQFITYINAYSEGDVVSYNFRNGDTWENVTATIRTHTIIDQDTIEVSFGVFPSSLTTQESHPELVLYPNPTNGNQLWFSIDENISYLGIYNLMGQNVLQLEQPESPINISDLKSGVYLIKISSQSGNEYISRFINK